MHYLFESHFCTPGAGHEKGGVEQSIGFVRRNYMTPLLQVSSYQELNERLRQSCLADDRRQVAGQKKSIKAAWAEEAPHLRLLPKEEMDYSRNVTAVLTPYSQIEVESNRYSVPTDKGELTDAF